MSGELTTHVLDTVRGIPAAGMRLVLSRPEEGGVPRDFKTDEEGRSALLVGEDLQAGLYVLEFYVGEYFNDPEGFLDVVPVRFRVTKPAAHYHIPLLCSPWAYSTYRGS